MKQVATGTYALGTRGHNFYILRDGDQVTIIDAGCSREWGKLIKGLDSTGLSLEAVAGIVATHSHADHLGFGRKAGQNGLSISVHEDEESMARWGPTPGVTPHRPRIFPSSTSTH